MRRFSLVVAVLVVAGCSVDASGRDDGEEGKGMGRLLGGRGDGGAEDGHANHEGDDGDPDGDDGQQNGDDGDEWDEGDDGWDDRDGGGGWEDEEGGASNGCLEMLACSAECGDDPCVEACLDAGSADGQAALFDLIDCYQLGCAEVTDDQIDACLEAQCPGQLAACT